MYIYPKLANQIIASFVLEFSGRGDLKAQKKFYINHLQKDWESHLVSTTSKASSPINPYNLIRKRLKSHLFFNHHKGLGTQFCLNQWRGSGSYLAPTMSNFFTNVSYISDLTLILSKVSATEYLLWRGYCCHSRNENLTLILCSLCKYT